MEVWKDVKGYEGLYQVSNLGRIKSLNYKRTGKEKIMKQTKRGNGYLRVDLCKDKKIKTYNVHRLVAMTFIFNEYNKPQVNHINEIKTDNRVENLEWVTSKENVNYGTAIKRRTMKLTNGKGSKPVIGMKKESGYIVEFPSVREVERTLKIGHSHVSNCCKGKGKTAGGYKWMFN